MSLNCETDPKVRQLELDQIRPQIVGSLRSLTTQELGRCIRALALWPVCRKFSPCPSMLNKDERALLHLRDELQKECLWRMSGSSEARESGLYLTEVGDRFMLATSWSLLQMKMTQGTFLERFVLKHSDKTNRSLSFFKRLSKDQIVEFLRLSDQIGRLPVNYHKYYALYKVFDLFDELDLNDMVLCLNVLQKHSMLTPNGHPLAMEFLGLILQKTQRFVEKLNDTQLLIILNFLHRYSSSLVKMDDQFENLVNSLESRTWSYWRLDTLLSLLALCCQTGTQKPNLWREVFLKITLDFSTPAASLKPGNLRLISTVICSDHQIFTPEEEAILLNKSANALQLANVQTKSDCFDLVFSTLSLLLKGHLLPILFESIFTNPTLTTVKPCGSILLHERYKFTVNDQVMTSTAHMMVAISKIARLDHPNYNGPMLEEFETFLSNYPSQKSSSFHGSSWLDCAQRLYKDLTIVLGGSDYVCETYVLPYAEVPTIVFGVDSETKKPVKLPEEYRQRKFTADKPAPNDMSGCEWFAIFLLSPKSDSLLMRFKGLLDPKIEHQVQTLGYTKLDFKSPELLLEFSSEGNQQIVTEFIQSRICPLVRISPKELI